MGRRYPSAIPTSIDLRRANELLRETISLLEVSHSLGLSSGSRRYDHFVQLDAVTLGEFKTRGGGLVIEYAQHPMSFGDVFITIAPQDVWRALPELPPGSLTSYSWVADRVGAPGSARAVGRAIGANRVALLTPCHRAIQQSGKFGNYH